MPATQLRQAAAAEVKAELGAPLPAADPALFDAAVARACDALAAAEPDITHMDNIAGDGDCGLTLKEGATGA